MVGKKNKISYSETYVMTLYASSLQEYMLMMLLKICVKQIQLAIKTTKISYNPIIDKNANAYEIFKRLQTFFPPNQYVKFNGSIRKGIMSRNKFIHSAFLTHADEFQKLPHVEEILKNNRESLTKLYLWCVDIVNANVAIVNMISKLNQKNA